MTPIAPYQDLIDHHVRRTIRKGARAILRHTSPGGLAAWARVLTWNLFTAPARRRTLERPDRPIPRMILASITQACNLQCPGCFAKALKRDRSSAMDPVLLDRVCKGALDCGIPFVFILGGEPFTHPIFFDAAARYSPLLFPVITNGLLVDQAMVDRLAQHRNIIPIFSIEGGSHHTDTRRGTGVHGRVGEAIRALRRRRGLCGVSVTVTSANLDTVLDDSFIAHQRDLGVSLFLFAEYEDVDGTNPGLCLDPDQKSTLLARVDKLAAIPDTVVVSFPGNEEAYGGCLAAGRGFIHIDADGSLEPCPMAPFSDVSLRTHSLIDALDSRFLRAIRDEHPLLTVDNGVCALWRHKDRTRELMDNAIAAAGTHMPVR